MQKNVSGQKIGAQMVTASDGTAFTGAVTVYVTGDAGTQAVGSVGAGACTHEGNGYHTYAPAQAETNYTLIAFTFIGTGAVPATVQAFTVGYDPTLANLPANVTQISGDSAAADSLETMLDGTGGNLLSLGRLVVDNSTGSGSAFVCTAGANGSGISSVGQGTGHGISATATDTGHGVRIVGGGTSGDGINITTTSGDGIDVTGGTAGHGIKALGGATGTGIQARGNDSGSGMAFIAGPLGGVGVLITGGSSSGDGVSITTTSGDGVDIAAGGAFHGVKMARGTSGADDLHLANSDAPTLANVVWNELKSAHTTPDSFGDYLDNEVSEVGGGVAQTGDSYAIVNSGTFGNSAIKAAVATVQTTLDDVDTLDEAYTGSTTFKAIMERAAATALQTATITVTSQTVFVLSAGSADNDAYNDCVAIFVDASTAVQKSVVSLSAYVGSTRTVTLAASPKFTIATGDTVYIVAAGDVTASALAEIASAAGSGTLTDANFESVPLSRTFRLVTSSNNELVGDKTRVLDIDSGAKTFAIEFGVDLATNRIINTVGTPTIYSGTAAGVTFGTNGRDKTVAKIRVTGVTAGTYVIEVPVVYDSGIGATAKVTIKVVD